MDRTATLLRTAQQLRRRIWASLPRGFRILSVLLHLSSSIQDALGRLVYAEFLRKGVRGMPDVRGKPADQYVQEMEGKIHDRYLADKLPPGYGRSFGTRVFSFLMGRLKNLSDVDEVISRFMQRYLEGSGRGMVEELTVKQAEDYVLKGVWNEALNYLKRQKSQREESLTRTDEGGEIQLDVRDPKTFEDLDEVFPDWHQPKVRRDLMSIAVWVPAYLDLATEGYDDSEIFGWSPRNPYSGSEPSVLAKKMGVPFVPRPGSKDEPLGRGLWSKPDVGTKVRIVDMLSAHSRGP